MQKRSSVLYALSMLTSLSVSVVACSGGHGGPDPDPTDGGTGDPVDPGPPDTAVPERDGGRADTEAPAPPAPPAPACGGFTSSDSACNTCVTGTCCSLGAACGANAMCSALSTCVNKCSTSACVSACATTYAGGVDDLTAFLSCTKNRCNGACTSATKGIGDSCSTSAECISGSCTGKGGWCTTTCAQNTDCRSSPSSITNEYGHLDWCAATVSGSHKCFPGCTYNSDCSPYPGTKCVTVTAVNGTSTGMCSF